MAVNLSLSFESESGGPILGATNNFVFQTKKTWM